MRAKRSRLIVIDASIARAAAATPDSGGEAARCRRFLEAVLELCHRAVWSPEIEREWKRHASRFSRKWRVQMDARRKLDRCQPPTVGGLSERIQSGSVVDLNPEVIRKDLHLVEAALAAEGIIGSLDERFRTQLAAAVNSASELRTILWINPAGEADAGFEWLSGGIAPDARAWVCDADR